MRMNPWIRKFTEMGNHPDDSEDEKIRKTTLTVLAIPFAMAGVLWGVLYFSNDLPTPGWIPMGYGILSLLSFVYFSISKKYYFFRNSQLFLILILPFLLQLSLGGFIPSSAVILWALISPLSALVFFKTKKSIGWFIAYCILLFIAYFINDRLPEYFNWDISEDFINAVFLLNLLAVSVLIYIIQYYYVGKQTELKEAIEEKSQTLAEQAEQLKELDEIKSRFFANISHEFRTPLTLILGLINKQVNQPDQPMDIQDSATIQRNANRLLQLINQLLDLSKIESGELKLQASHGDIVGFTYRIFSMFESMASGKNIDLSFNDVPLNSHSDHKSIELYFDHEKLQKVITNLISNAVKFTPQKGRIRVNVEAPEEHVNVIISNTGPGIAPNVMPYVFDRFFQADAENTREYEGTGIGLALVKELTELHQGSVSVESKEGLTIFRLSLPLAAEYLKEEEKTNSPVLSLTEETLSPDHPTQSSSKASIFDHKGIFEPPANADQLEVLIVEDNPDLRAYIKSILENDYKVMEAVDGQDGFEKAEAHIPDMIVSDVMMPRMDGYQLCKALKTNTRTNHIPVVLLTAKASQENKMEGLSLGADDYLIKPFNEAELGIRIKNLIAIRARLQEKYQQGILTSSKAAKVDSIHQKFLEEVRAAIEKHIDNDQFSVDDLGHEIAMSRSQIHRKLKALTDLSATAFIRQYRLHKAADLLKQEAGSITDIAYQVGFSSQTYFSSSFQELFGCSPSEYLANH